jgi:hypothetical protein
MDMGDRILCKEEIDKIVNDPTLEDGYQILSKLKNETKNKYRFENELRHLFPNSTKVTGKISKAVEKFISDYKNEKKALIKRIKDEAIDDSLTQKGQSYVCDICSEQLLGNKHKAREHFSKMKHFDQDKITGLLENDPEFLRYRNQPFLLAGLNEEKPKEVGTDSV